MKDSFPLNCLRRTNVHIPQETKSSQMIVGLLSGHLKQTDWKKTAEEINLQYTTEIS